MYRSRPKENLDDEVLRFLSSAKEDEAILPYDILGSEAHTIMLHEMGHITLVEVRKILAALEELRKNPGNLVYDGYEDVHEALEAFVIKRAGSEAGGKMHTARSRNDQVVLDVRMKIRDDINDICAALADLIDGLIERACETKTTPVPLYTHLQHGQIGTFSHYLLSYAFALMRDMERLYLTYQRINQSPLGACAIGGSSIPIDRKRTAVMLGFDSIVKNSIDATSSRDVFLEYVADLSILASTLARIAEDFIIWSTSEFGYLELADRFSSTSSAMPQKKNPDPLEIIRAKSAIITGYLVAMLGIVKALPSGYSRDLQEMKTQLFGSSVTIVTELKVMNGMIRSVQINKEGMIKASNSSYAIALDIAEQLVITEKVPFRTAHGIVGALVDKAVARGNVPLAKLQQEDIAVVIREKKSNLRAGRVAEIIRDMTPDKSLKVRKSAGSPHPSEQEEMIKTLSEQVANFKAGVQKRIKMVQGSFDSLSRTVDKYIES
ncbi:MAG: argininosuccinate lyase [Nitrososphaera sp.]